MSRCYGCGNCTKCEQSEIEMTALLAELNSDPVWLWLKAEAFYRDGIELAREAREFERADRR
jgi:hypothetical protein